MLNFSEYKNTKPYAMRSKNKDMWEAYNAEESRVIEKFKADMFDDLGISDNPKRNELYRVAWDYGHSSGIQEVYNYALDLVDLIKD